MQTTQKSDKMLLKYALILLSAVALNGILWRMGLLNWNFVSLGINHYVQDWTGDFQPVESGALLQAVIYAAYKLLALDLFSLMGIGLVLTPFILIIVSLLYVFKQSWLPQNDPFLFKIQDFWMLSICSVFALILLLDLLFGSLLHARS